MSNLPASGVGRDVDGATAVRASQVTLHAATRPQQAARLTVNLAKGEAAHELGEKLRGENLLSERPAPTRSQGRCRLHEREYKASESQLGESSRALLFAFGDGEQGE